MISNGNSSSFIDNSDGINLSPTTVVIFVVVRK